MTDKEQRAKNAEYQRRYRESRRNDPAYWEKLKEYKKRYRDTHKEEIKEQNATYYKKKHDSTDDSASPAPPLSEYWHSPSITVVCCESRKFDRGCIIEHRKGSGTYRMKIVVIGSDVSSLKECARRVGFNVFQDTPPTIK